MLEMSGDRAVSRDGGAERFYCRTTRRSGRGRLGCTPCDPGDKRPAAQIMALDIDRDGFDEK
jgi:hypothetical protein